MAVLRELLPPRVESAESSECGANPNNSGAVLIKNLDGVVAQTVGIVRIVAVMLERLSVIPVQAVGSAEPHEAIVVLGDRGYPLLKRFALNRQPHETDVLL